MHASAIAMRRLWRMVVSKNLWKEHMIVPTTREEDSYTINDRFMSLELIVLMNKTRKRVMSREPFPSMAEFSPGPEFGSGSSLAPAPAEHLLSLRDLLSRLGIAAVFLDPQLHVAGFTPQAKQLFLLSENDLGRPIDEVPRSFQCARFKDILESARDSGQAPEVEVHLASGRWFLARLHPLSTAPPFKLVLTFVDITMFKEAEIARDQLAAIVQCSNDAIVGKTLDGIVTSWNPAAEQMFGYTAEEMIGQSMMPMIPPEFQARLPKAYEALRNGERVQHVDLELIRKGGGRFPVALTLSPMRDGAGECVGISAIIRDVTEQKLSEERLAVQSLELARSNAELEQFAGVISHDLRSPLLSITGCLQLLEEEFAPLLPATARQDFKYARESVTRMGDLIKGLLDYSRMAPQQPGRCDMQAAFDKAVANLRAAVRKADATATSDPLPVVIADEKLLVQVLQNLIENALKYQEGSRPPIIHVLFQDSPAEWIFGVRDNGIGIDPQHFGRIFQIFQRLHGDEGKYTGLGVGLATAKKIIERHGGRMWVESVPGEGSTFFFTLPKTPPESTS
jgi:PAS domain S-box-containing protein